MQKAKKYSWKFDSELSAENLTLRLQRENRYERTECLHRNGKVTWIVRAKQPYPRATFTLQIPKKLKQGIMLVRG